MSTFLRDKLSEIIYFIRCKQDFLDYNNKIQKVAEGDMLSIMLKEFEKLETKEAKKNFARFAISHNYLEHIVDKRSQVFTFPLELKCSNPADQPILDYYVNKYEMISQFHQANRYANGGKSALLQIGFDDENDPIIRGNSNEKFLVWTDSLATPDRPKVYILFIKDFLKLNKITKQYAPCVKIHLFTKDEFLACDSDGDIDEDETAKSEGLNTFGEVPFEYINYTPNYLLPIVNKDLLQSNIMINTLFTESKVANWFQGHPIRWIKNWDKSRSSLNISQDSILVLNGSEDSDKDPEIGELAVSLSHSESLALIEKMEKTLSFLAKVNLSGFVENKSQVSGDALIMLGQDILEDRKKQIVIFKPRIESFLTKLAKIHNERIKKNHIGPTMPTQLFSEEFGVEAIFSTPDTAQAQKDEQQGTEEDIEENSDAMDTNNNEEEIEEIVEE